MALPIKWFLVHVEFIGTPPNITGAKVTVNGQDLTESMDDSALTTSGSGSFDPTSKQAAGSGNYTIKDKAGAATAQGTWQVTDFVSWQQLPGEFPPDFKVEGDPPPPGTRPSAGILTVKVKLDNLGDGVMEVHCMLPTTPDPDKKLIEGVRLSVGKFKFDHPAHIEGAPTEEATIFFVPTT